MHTKNKHQNNWVRDHSFCNSHVFHNWIHNAPPLLALYTNHFHQKSTFRIRPRLSHLSRPNTGFFCGWLDGSFNRMVVVEVYYQWRHKHQHDLLDGFACCSFEVTVTRRRKQTRVNVWPWNLQKTTIWRNLKDSQCWNVESKSFQLCNSTHAASGCRGHITKPFSLYPACLLALGKSIWVCVSLETKRPLPPNMTNHKTVI